ncbi:MAG: class I SAM-dependent methyltransferase [Desulfobulbaceae bacterium]|nr:class I SAM-dependent methyltransferase [Desulfobulbaceae bacterium]
MQTPPTSLCVTDKTGCHQAEVESLTTSLSAQRITVLRAVRAGDFELCFSHKGLVLQENGGRAESILVDFASDTFLYRLQKGGGRRQPLARAVGLQPGYSPLVLDATAGLGRDGFILASLGCRVIFCERSPIVHALLHDGLARAATDPRLSAIASRISLYAGDCRALLPALSEEFQPDTIYLDPMYPSRSKKSALIKKEMRMIRALVGDDHDTSALLQAAIEHAAKRVVCKRPIQAPPLELSPQGSDRERQPDFAITTPKHRFDVYLPLSNKSAPLHPVAH